jgi:hypothetical protein
MDGNGGGGGAGDGGSGAGAGFGFVQHRESLNTGGKNGKSEEGAGGRGE